MLSHDNALDACRHLKPLESDSGGTLGQILALKSNLVTCKKLTEADFETGKLIAAFRDNELKGSEQDTERVRRLAWQIRLVLAIAVVGSIFLACLLFAYFMRGIHRGVRSLLLNIQRFKTGETLAPALEGSDELAVLDARFHKMADEVAAAQQMKQAFHNTVSRELGIPIKTAKDYLTQLCKGSFGELSEEATVHARKAEKTLERLIGLMNDLLALQSGGKAKMEVHPRMSPVEDMMQSSMDSVSAFADTHGVRLQRSDTNLEAYADPDRVVQVIVNLLSNAIKFSDRGSSVVISAAEIDEQVEIRVQDSGRGIPANKRASVFEKFEQVASTDATEKGGTGLGLPICKEIIESHGGVIGVISEEGKGSTFWFRLPNSPPGQG
jgi:signal transduction histidine kinase